MFDLVDVFVLVVFGRFLDFVYLFGFPFCCVVWCCLCLLLCLCCYLHFVPLLVDECFVLFSGAFRIFFLTSPSCIVFAACFVSCSVFGWCLASLCGFFVVKLRFFWVFGGMNP